VIERLARARDHEFSLERAAFLTVLHALFCVGSDRAADRWREDYCIDGIDGLELHHLPRHRGSLGRHAPSDGFIEVERATDRAIAGASEDGGLRFAQTATVRAGELSMRPLVLARKGRQARGWKPQWRARSRSARLLDDWTIRVLADDGGPHAVAQDLAPNAANRLERGDVTAQDALQVLVDDEARPDQTAVTEDHREQPDDALDAGLVDERDVELGEFDPRLFAERRPVKVGNAGFRVRKYGANESMRRSGGGLVL
jgi:hypothetical protein